MTIGDGSWSFAQGLRSMYRFARKAAPGSFGDIVIIFWCVTKSVSVAMLDGLNVGL